MAAKKTRGGINVQISENAGKSEPENEPGSSEQSELETALDSLPEGTIAKLHRLEPNGDKAWVDQTAPAAMDEQRIASHGAGIYIVTFRGPLNDGTSRVGYRGSRRVVIGESAARAALAAVAAPAPASAPVNTGAAIMDQLAGGMLLGMMNQMQQASATQAQQAREHSAAMMALIGKMGEKPPTDPLMMTLLTELLTKRGDPIEQATRIAEIASKNGGGGGGSRDIIAALELADRIRERGGDGGGSNDKGWVGIFRELAPLVFKQGGEPQPSNPQLAAGSPPNEVTADTSLTYLDPLMPFIPQITQSAEVGTDAATAADYYISFVPPGHYPILAGILDRPSVVVDIVRRAPALARFDAWLVILVQEMRAAIMPESDGDGGSE